MPSHGKIGKAGKVRKQTCYEESKELTSKILVGRAKKRKQYAKNYKILIATPLEKKRIKYNDNSNKSTNLV